MRTDDGDLIGRTLAGDQSAFAELVNRYRDAVCGVAYHYLGDFDGAQDAAQEAFVQAYLRLHQLREPEKFGPWLRRVTANVCLGLLRRQGGTSVSLDHADEQSPPPDDVHRIAVDAVVREALGRLSDKTRLTVTLAFINGYLHAEIADFLEVPVNTVRSRLQHAKRQLREEMMAMVTDMLHEGRPDEDFVGRIIKAIRSGIEAHEARAVQDEVRHIDEQLQILTEMESSSAPERHRREFLKSLSRLKTGVGGVDPEALARMRKMTTEEFYHRRRMDLLRAKGHAFNRACDFAESRKYYEELLAIAERFGYRDALAEMLTRIGVDCDNLGDREKAEEYYSRALEAYREAGDLRGQGNCLIWLGSQRIFANQAAAGKAYYEQALPLLEASNSHDWVAACHAMLDVFAEVGEERFPTLVSFSACCDGLEEKAGTVCLALQIGNSKGSYHPDAPALSVSSVFWQVSHARKFLDASVPVGGAWSGVGTSYSYQPLKVTVSVKSDSERITVPAGTFRNCLMTEQVTTESDLTDDASDRKKELNRSILCGVRRAWYGPGVGLVQVHVRIANGTEALIQLKDYSMQGASESYLPLAIGNSWTYGRADIPAEYVAKEAYRVTAHAGDVWYLEHYAYAYKE